MTGTILADQRAHDGTRKIAVAFGNGAVAEASLLHLPRAVSTVVCISTQAGCPFRCGFCVNGTAPFGRNLTASEMIAQVDLALESDDRRRSFDVSLMGAGEPFANGAVDKLVWLLRRRFIGLQMINISTVGPRRAPLVIGKHWLSSGIHLQWSLHTPFDEERRAVLGPGLAPVRTMLDALSRHSRLSGDRPCVNYSLFKDWNDGPSHLDTLARLLEGLAVYVKVSSYAPINQTTLNGASAEEADLFAEALRGRGVDARRFSSSGTEIGAGCGQMASRLQRSEAAWQKEAASRRNPYLV